MNGKRLMCLAAAGLLTITGPAYGQKGKPSASACGTGNIPLVVTVFDSPTQLVAGDDPLVTTDGIDPLGYAAYQYEANQSPGTDGRPVPLTDGGKGSQKVIAHFEIENCAFDFVLNLNFTSRDLVADLSLTGPIRSEFLRFDRIASVPVTLNNPSFATWCSTAITSLQSPAPYDNYGGCGGSGTPEDPFYVRRAAGGSLYEGPARDYRYRFRRSPLDANYSDCQINADLCLGSYVRVYRPDASTWIITPDTDVRDIDNNIVPPGDPARPSGPATVSIVSFVDNNETSLLGHETMPFRMMLKVK